MFEFNEKYIFSGNLGNIVKSVINTHKRFTHNMNLL
jgi:hypothetical protein